MKNVFTFILIALVILGCGKTNQSSHIDPKPVTTQTTSEQWTAADVMDDILKKNESDTSEQWTAADVMDDMLKKNEQHDPESEQDLYSKYLSPSESTQWLRQNSVESEKRPGGGYILTFRGPVIIPISSTPRPFTLENSEVLLVVDNNNEIRIRVMR